MIVARALAEYSLKRYALATHSCSWILLLADSSSARLSGFSLLSILNEAALKTENNVKKYPIKGIYFIEQQQKKNIDTKITVPKDPKGWSGYHGRIASKSEHVGIFCSIILAISSWKGYG